MKKVNFIKKEQGSLVIQSIICSKDVFKSEAEARKWIEEHNFSVEYGVDETDTSYRYRQRDPSDFIDDSFVTVQLTDGVVAVMGKLKENKENKNIYAKLSNIKEKELNIKEKELKEGRIRVRFTEKLVDRDGDVVLPRAFEFGGLDNFKKNPIVLYTHNKTEQRLPVGKVDIDSIEITDETFEGDIIFDLNDPFAKLVYEKYKNGFLNAFSIGFRCLEYGEPILDGQKGITVLKAELLEISCVAIPSNPNALVLEKQFIDSLIVKDDSIEPTNNDNIQEILLIVKEILSLVRSIDNRMNEQPEVSIEGDKILKVGRVLSKKNEQAIRNAIQSLQEILALLEEREEDVIQNESFSDIEEKEYWLERMFSNI